MNKKKILNDPVYGFVSIQHDLIYDLIQHPYVQRLRRISQLGMTHLTYPGAVHSRFHHALGAMHLMALTVANLRQKSVEISPEEEEAVYVAILLHDIGHGPFSHALEGILLPQDHEEITLSLLHDLNSKFDDRLTLAIRIFRGEHPRKFLSSLISSQLDMDRLDYLNRDSFYTGVMEGKIGYDRIIKMLTVVNDQLMVEEKGVHSIEKYLVARKIMYWQVYLHKTVLSAECMLIGAVRRALALHQIQHNSQASASLQQLFDHALDTTTDPDASIKAFVAIDDVDILAMLKGGLSSADFILRYLSEGLLSRNLFRVSLHEAPVDQAKIVELTVQSAHRLGIPHEIASKLVYTGRLHTDTYQAADEPINFVSRSGAVKPLDQYPDLAYLSTSVQRYFLCHPRLQP